MTISLLKEADGLGEGEIDVLRAFGDFLVAANDTGLGLGDEVDGRLPITYTRTENGPTHLRLDELVNTEFTPDYGDGPQSVDIVVLSVPDGFVYDDGSIGLTNNGVALAPSGSGLAGDSLNPTDNCLVIYDTELNICVARDGTDGALDLTVPGPIVLYHELSHAHRIVTNGLLELGGPCDPSSAEENAAILDENDMRTMLADLLDEDPVLRDPGIHCGGECGTDVSDIGSCCIVASVVSGSPRSAEVQQLRQVRDQFLRRTETGYHFFEWLHYDYYAFSPQIATMLAGDPELSRRVLEGYVEPLLDFWAFMGARAGYDRPSPEVVGRLLAESLPTGESGRERQRALQASEDYWLASTSGDGSEDDPLGTLLHNKAWPSEIVQWALIRPLPIYGEALGLLLAGTDFETLGRTVGDLLDPWTAELPIHPVWGSLPGARLADELAMCNQLIQSDEARRAFRTRLIARFPRVTAIQEVGTNEDPDARQEVDHGRY